AIQPNPIHHSNLLQIMQYMDNVTLQALLAAHQQWSATYNPQSAIRNSQSFTTPIHHPPSHSSRFSLVSLSLSGPPSLPLSVLPSSPPTLAATPPAGSHSAPSNASTSRSARSPATTIA